MQRSYIKYTSINAILSDIHSMIDSIDWDEGRMLEWATKGLRKINLPAKYEDVVTFVSVHDHVGMLPKDIKYINQMFYKLSDSSVTDEELIQLINEQLGITEDKPFYEHMAYPDSLATRMLDLNTQNMWFKPLRKNDGTFGVSPCAEGKVPFNRCDHQYTLYGKEGIQTSFRNGCVLLSYKRYIKDCDGYDLVPDNENLKEALFHYCMYRWWMSRMTYKEEGSERQMSYHLQQYQVLVRRSVAELNTPSIDTMENIKNYRDRLIPRTNFYDNGFSQLSNRENIDF